MKIITTISEMQEFSRGARAGGKTIGFVPTMGYLHEGHLSLVRAAREECDIVVLSIYVNPIQFCAGEDLDKYPRDIERDKALAEKEGADVIYAPDDGAMYPAGYATRIEVKAKLINTMCGVSRPGHFIGVTTIVNKLFNIVCPDKAYFGQKDAQQVVVIKKMVEDLNIPVEIRTMPVVREADGLAMSSRNSYLSKEERKQALGIYRAVKKAEEMIAAGELSADRIKGEMSVILREGKDVRIDYIEIVDAGDLEEVERVNESTLIAIAAHVGKTRLIDNMIIESLS
ncbi:MAG: pantoate--beta-alanine ligase [Candidatus Omnitrophica bacterium]|nr:pantoate--beta-alanine ligase [Candidatus Omnitrophota bacterium]